MISEPRRLTCSALPPIRRAILSNLVPGLLAIGLILGLSPSVQALAAFRGDIDGDGAITAADLVLLQNHLAKTAPLSGTPLLVADVNGDGKVDPGDAVALREVILGKRAPKLLPDTDGDGLPDSVELVLGLNPRKADTNGNGRKDGDEDPDQDGLSNAAELLAGTDPNRWDTDGDGWSDEAEVAAGSNPRDPASRPRLFISASPKVLALRPAPATGPLLVGLFGGTPPVRVVRPASDPGSAPLNAIVATPPVKAKIAGQ